MIDTILSKKCLKKSFISAQKCYLVNTFFENVEIVNFFLRFFIGTRFASIPAFLLEHPLLWRANVVMRLTFNLTYFYKQLTYELFLDCNHLSIVLT